MADTINDSLRNHFLAALIASWCLMFIIRFIEAHTLLLVLAPIAVMCFYLYNFMQMKEKESYRDQFAESFYSLGFLLTLSALVLTFLPFFDGTMELTPEATLGNFGVALFTTLFGLTVRIWMTSFSQDFEDMKKETAVTLERDIRAFEMEMQSAVDIMHGFNERLDTATHATVENFGSAMKDAGKAIPDAMETALKDALTPLGDTMKHVSSSISRTTTDFGDELRQAFACCIESINEARIDPTILHDSLTPIVERMTVMAAEIEKHTLTAGASLRSGSEELDGAMADFSSSIGALGHNLLNSLEKIALDLKELDIDQTFLTGALERMFGDLDNAVSDVATQIRDHGSALGEGATIVKESLPAYQEASHALKTLADSGNRIENSLANTVDVSNRIGDIAHELKNLTNTSHEYITAIGESVATHKEGSRSLEIEQSKLEEARKTLATEYARVGDDLRQLGISFTDIARFVTRTLNDEERHGQTEQQ